MNATDIHLLTVSFAAICGAMVALGTFAVLRSLFGDWWQIHRAAVKRRNLRRNRVAVVTREAVERLKDAA